MNDDPRQIADNFIKLHGVDGALKAVSEEIAAVHAKGDNYRLSIWRETKQILQSHRDAAANPEAPAV
jgi:hypothetical protein